MYIQTYAYYPDNHGAYDWHVIYCCLLNFIVLGTRVIGMCDWYTCDWYV